MTLKQMFQRYFETNMKLSLVLFLSFCILGLNAQVVTTPLQSNHTIIDFLEDNPDYEWSATNKTKWGTLDTLELPFFDDFSTSNIYPDSTKWRQNYVYINNHFPKFPPTLNVATFDALDVDGRPYNALNKDFISYGDSLMSQPINLKDSSGVPYTLGDSIIFSFFYQPNGYGYHLNGEDSLRVYFKSDDNTWTKVWSRGGQAPSQPFQHVSIAIDNASYLHEDFQFLFTTITRQVGNANHWHIDYVNLDSKRSKAINYYDDYAMQTTPTSLLKNFYEMPYAHYEVNPTAETPDSIYFRVSNLFNVTKNIRVNHTEEYNSTVLANTAFSTNTANVLAQSNAERRVNIFSFTGLAPSGFFKIKRTFRVNQGGAPNAITSNDSMVFYQKFSDYYAYDDGSAERGFGFDQDINPSNIEGQMALRFNLKKQDTLYAIATYFNEAVFDVSTERFKYKVWQQIEGINGGTEDVVLYESSEQVPNYQSKDGRRNYTYHYLDTTLILPPGDFYIGWTQASIYNLNVGWDMNFGNDRNPNQKSTHLYYKLFNVWSNTDLPEGTLMMRPHFGSARDIIASVDYPIIEEQPLQLYPNPASSYVKLSQEFANVWVHNELGQSIFEASNCDGFNVSGMQDGIYFVIAQNEKGQVVRSKLIIFAR